MNGGGRGYPRYGGGHWEDDGSSSSAYEVGHMSPYRGDSRGSHHQHSVPSNGYSSDPGSMASSEDGPTYVLEHLATFRVSPEAGLVFPSDGMRRLLHMEKTTGIWTQKMLLKLEKRWVFILSHENGDVVEKFPLELIREPTAFTSEDPKELYNNIFIFVVAEDPKRKYDNPTEMHIFQCLRISAKDVVEDMKLYMSGKTLSGLRAGRELIPPPPAESAPEPPLLGNGYRDFYAAEVRGGPRSERSSVSHNDEVSSTSSERYERDVAILNNCFDDIERFIARLQHTAAATRELERRRRSRKSKKKDIGDGLLSMRAKPPPEREFMDIFQKFKLSFNLLAKLRAHIRDPNAPELVHFLFTPLALIVDASRDSYFEPTLPPKVVSPLLTQDAIDLLTNCLTSRETELWHSLGDSWLVPKEAWKYPVTPYRPVFYSGWAPEISDEARRFPLHSHGYPERNESDLRRSAREDFEYYDSDRRELSPPPSDIAHMKYRSPQRDERPRSMTPLSEYHHDPLDPQGFERSQRKWLDEMKSRGAKIVQVTYPRTANNDKELTVVRGEFLEVIDDSRKWWKATNSRHVTAHVPHTIVTPYVPEDHLDMHRGPSATRQGKKGSHFHSNELSHHRKTPIPSPPPLPPQGTWSSLTAGNQKNRPPSSQNIFGSTRSHADLMNEELKEVLEDFRKTRPHLEINKTPDVYISQTSTPKEVQEWLKMKSFSEKIWKLLEGVDGERLFSYSRQHLEKLCGKTEGSRLASQIIIQRNVSGYKTARTKELKQVLEEQRKRIESSKPIKAPVKQETSLVYSSSSFKELPSTPSDDENNVANNFQFLQQYDTGDRDSYDSDDSEGTIKPTSFSTSSVQTKTNQPSKSAHSSGGTLKDQIKNQHKKIVKQPNEVITGR